MTCFDCKKFTRENSEYGFCEHNGYVVRYHHNNYDSQNIRVSAQILNCKNFEVSNKIKLQKLLDNIL